MKKGYTPTFLHAGIVNNVSTFWNDSNFWNLNFFSSVLAQNKLITLITYGCLNIYILGEIVMNLMFDRK